MRFVLRRGNGVEKNIFYYYYYDDYYYIVAIIAVLEGPL